MKPSGRKVAKLGFPPVLTRVLSSRREMLVPTRMSTRGGHRGQGAHLGRSCVPRTVQETGVNAAVCWRRWPAAVSGECLVRFLGVDTTLQFHSLGKSVPKCSPSADCDSDPFPLPVSGCEESDGKLGTVPCQVVHTTPHPPPTLPGPPARVGSSQPLLQLAGPSLFSHRIPRATYK